MPSISGGLYQRGHCLGFEQITSIASAKTLTPTTGLGPTEAEVQIEGGTARMRMDGTAPTASIGYLCQDGDVLLFDKGQDLTKVKFIQASGTLILNVHYF
jgi:hypothetical protein